MSNSKVRAVDSDLPSPRRAFLQSAAAKLDLTTGVNPELLAALADAERSHLAFVKSLDRVGAAEKAAWADKDDEAAQEALKKAEEAKDAADDRAIEALERFASIRATTLPEFRLKATLSDTFEFEIVAKSLIRDLLAL